MDKAFLAQLGISEEQISKIVEHAKESMKDFIPKARFDEVNNAKKDLETKIGELEAFKGGVEALKAEIQTLKDESKRRELEYEKRLEESKIDSMIESALHGAKAKSIKAVRAYLDTSKLKLDGETLKGLDEQIKSIRENEETAFLFQNDAPAKSPLSGISPTMPGKSGAGEEKAVNLRHAIEMHYEKMNR